MYNNNHATQPAAATRVDGGADKSRAIRIAWTGRNDSTKGILTSNALWDKGEYYILAVCARVPDGQPENGKIVLHYSNAPAWQDVEYLAQPTLSRNWQWTVMRARKPVQDSGIYSQMFATVDGAYTGEAVEYCLPYASKGEMWAGYKPADIVNMLYFSYGVGSPCRTVCTVCGSPPCMKNKSH